MVRGKARRLIGLLLVVIAGTESERSQVLAEVSTGLRVAEGSLRSRRRRCGRRRGATIPDVGVEIEMVLHHNILGVSVVWLFGDLNLGLSVQTAHTANAIRGGHQNRLISIAVIDVHIVKVAIGLNRCRSLELNGRCLHGDFVGCVLLELDEARVGIILRPHFLGLAVVHHHQLRFIGVELQLVLPLIRTRLAEILSIGELLTLRVHHVAIAIPEVRGRARVDRSYAKVIATGNDNVGNLTRLQIDLGVQLIGVLRTGLHENWWQIRAIHFRNRLDLQDIISVVSAFGDTDRGFRFGQMQVFLVVILLLL